MQREVGARLSPATQAFLKRRALARSQKAAAASPEGAAQAPMDASGAAVQQRQQEQAPAQQPHRSSQQQAGIPTPPAPAPRPPRPQQSWTGAATDIVRGVRFAVHEGTIVAAAVGAEDSQEQAWDAVVKRDPLRCALTASNTCCLMGEADGVLDPCCLCFISQTALCCVCRGSRSGDYSPHSQPAHNLLHKAAVSTQLALLCGLQAG